VAPGAGFAGALRNFRPRDHPRKTAAGVLWAFGLFCMLLAPSPVPITPAKEAAYESGVRAAAPDKDLCHAGEAKLWEAQTEEYHAKVWFWWFRAEHRRNVRSKQAVTAVAHAEMRRVCAVYEGKMAEARGHLGLWSDMGVQESRGLFWNSFERGKVFAKRQTFWDTLIHGLEYGFNRDENLLGFILRFLFDAAMNFTMGLLGSIFVFLWNLPKLIMSFNPSLLSAFAFFAVAAVSAVSLVASALGLIYAGAVGTAYMAASALGPTVRIGAAQRHPRHIRGGHFGAGRSHRAHYD